jgi:hypothetical protein
LTVSDVLDQILLRLDDEKEIKSIGLSKNVSRVDATESNQLLRSQVAIFLGEMECMIELWTRIETEGPITKSSY